MSTEASIDETAPTPGERYSWRDLALFTTALTVIGAARAYAETRGFAPPDWAAAKTIITSYPSVDVPAALTLALLPPARRLIARGVGYFRPSTRQPG